MITETNWSGRGDSNSRSPAPKAGALATTLRPEAQGRSLNQISHSDYRPSTFSPCTRGCSSMVEPQPSKLAMPVRSRSPAPDCLSDSSDLVHEGPSVECDVCRSIGIQDSHFYGKSSSGSHICCCCNYSKSVLPARKSINTRG